MSFEAMTWASKQRVGSPQRKAVLLTIANLSTPQGELLARQSYISRVSEASERSVREHLAALEEMGLLTRAHRRGRAGRHASDLIRLNMGEFAAETDDQDDAESPPRAAADAGGRAARAAAGEPPRAAGDAGRRAAGSAGGGAEKSPASDGNRSRNRNGSDSATKPDSTKPKNPPNPPLAGGAPPEAVDCAAWDHALNRLARYYGQSTFERYFEPLVLVRAPPDATVWAPSRFMAQWVPQHYGDRIAEFLGSRVRFTWGQQEKQAAFSTAGQTIG